MHPVYMHQQVNKSLIHGQHEFQTNNTKVARVAFNHYSAPNKERANVRNKNSSFNLK